MGTAAFRRLSNAADKAVEARNSLSAFELGAITALPVKRLSEELAAVLKKRDSWSASVSPLPLSLSQPDIVKAHTGRSPCEAPSCSPNCKASVTSGPVKVPHRFFIFQCCDLHSEGSCWTYVCWLLQAVGSIPFLNQFRSISQQRYGQGLLEVTTEGLPSVLMPENFKLCKSKDMI